MIPLETIFIIFSLIPSFWCAKPELPSYIKLQAYERTLHMNATGNCWSGGWAPQAIPGECLCIKGIWAVSTGYCDPETTIYTGDGHCFRLDKRKKIRKFFNLDANKLRPFSSNNYLISPAGHEWAKVKDSYRSTAHEEWQYLIRTNPRAPLFAKTYDPETDTFDETDFHCTPSVRPEYMASNNSKYIYISNVQYKNQFNQGTQGWCPKDWTSDYWVLTVGQSFRISDQQITEGKVGNPVSCSSARVVTTRSKKTDDIFYFGDKKEEGSKTAGRSKNAEPANETVDMTGVTHDDQPSAQTRNPNHTETFEDRRMLSAGAQTTERDNPNFDLRWPVEATHDEQVRQLEVQTSRLGTYYLEWAFNFNPGPKINHVKEFDYLQSARILLLKTCKSPVITTTAINNLFRWFRWIWRESLEVYPYTEVTDSEMHTRINTALKSCIAESKEMTVNYNNTCGDVGVTSVTYANETFTNRVPDGIRFDISRLEASIEFIWKIMMNAHYYCSKYFMPFPSDHSALNVRFEGVFSPLIRKRWDNPGMTYTLMTKLWSTYKLSPIFEAIDSCVATSHTISDYKEWMARPINEDPATYYGKYPIRIPPTVVAVATPGRRKKRSALRRKKRDSGRIRNLWGHLAYCLENPSDVPDMYGATGTCLQA